MSGKHPYLKANNRWKIYREYWKKHCKPFLAGGCSGSDIADYQFKTYIDFLYLTDYKTKSYIIPKPYPDLDLQDKYYDGLGYYDKLKNIEDHMEKI
tara:strand:+ start:11822 stop:12109 length:288 start_codon:yes stop_codon:yes gene_type:complete